MLKEGLEGRLSAHYRVTTRQTGAASAASPLGEAGAAVGVQGGFRVLQGREDAG